MGEGYEFVRILNIINVFFIFRLVITTCIFTPYAMAFVPDFDLNMTIFDGIMNVLFLTDIFVIFFSAYVDQDYNLIDDLNVC